MGGFRHRSCFFGLRNFYCNPNLAQALRSSKSLEGLSSTFECTRTAVVSSLRLVTPASEAAASLRGAKSSLASLPKRAPCDAPSGDKGSLLQVIGMRQESWPQATGCRDRAGARITGPSRSELPPIGGFGMRCPADSGDCRSSDTNRIMIYVEAEGSQESRGCSDSCAKSRPNRDKD